MNPTFKTLSRVSVATPQRHKNCYLCDATVQIAQIRPIDQMFHEDVRKSQKSWATILSDVLEQNIEETTVHSKIVCRKCQTMCNEYDRLVTRLQQLKQNITTNFNETVNKYNLKVIEMDMEQHFETINENDVDGNISNMYAIESVDDPIGQVFENENVNGGNDDVVNNAKESQIKKVMLIKSEDGSNPFFAISGIDESIDDDQAIHTVLLEDINETTEFGDSATNTNDGMSDEPSEHHHDDASEQYIVTEHLDDGKEYFEQNGDQMIEISTNGDMNDSNYLVFQEDSADDEPDDDENSSEMGEHQKLSTYDESSAASFMKDHSDGVTFQAKTSMRSGGGNNKRGGNNNATTENKVLFLRDGKNYQCLLCQPSSMVVYDSKTISIHLKTDHKERIYVCGICGLDFRKRNPYNDHMDDHVAALADGTFECELCKSSFTDARQFRIHKKTHNAPKIWPCTACGKKYSSKNLLDEHMNMHTGARPYKCPHCAKDFASKYTLTAHMKIHNDRKRPFECTTCFKSFFSNQNLTQHIRTHTGIKEFECDVCKKKFGSQHNLEVHRIIHTGHKPFICRTCGKAFARRAEIKDHERTHTGERPYKCDMCTSSFAQRSNLMSHKRATHLNDKRYKCETCSRSFKRRRLLEYHIKATHTGERPYKCATCNATFVYPEHYKKHIRIHTGVKPFACEKCGKTFNSRDNRNAHRYVHSDKKPYECLVCHQGFMRKPLLYAHMEQQQHLNDQIIVNPPDFKKDSNDFQNDQSNDGDIVYLSINDEEFMDDDEFTLEEEHIVDESEIISEEHLMSDSQFSSSGGGGGGAGDESTDAGNRPDKQFLVRQKRHNLTGIDHLDVNIKDSHVTYIETAGTDPDDPLNLEQMVDGVNVSWIGLSS
ncbi:zinc finger protein 431-like [Contarinia nasturtii]|uniref:zinc finger protein 431-like n=1 Tax=Contarinia nasturtii TaxID=265458 RepID=UPI0012D40F1A|nr:zinc finger protein 431-like [Contarinia nasturtii]XP_031639039.1 zinc finger protein 431-like [Contarinia nasturtii]